MFLTSLGKNYFFNNLLMKISNSLIRRKHEMVSWSSAINYTVKLLLFIAVLIVCDRATVFSYGSVLSHY